MRSNTLRAGVALAAVAACGAFTAAAEAGWAEDREVVIEWNGLLTASMPPTAGLFTPRYYAMLHIAMFDAANSVERDYEPYHIAVQANPAASVEAAAAQAARDVLAALVPAAEASFDAALQNRLAKIHPMRAARGAAIGKTVAQAILDWRTGDGAEQPNLPYVPPALTGVWQPASPGQVAAFVQFANVAPFALPTPTLHFSVPSPLLNSAEYAADVEQVKSVGSIDSAVRTADQTLTARLFAGAGYTPSLPFALWNHVTRDVARAKSLSLVATARAFALVNAAMHDGVQSTHTAKYIYGLWRPIHAIRRADEDLNDQTAADPSWTPLINTPPYPSHPSNLTCVGASAARALGRVFRTDAVPFTLTWTGTNGNADVTRAYTSFTALAEEGAWSRVYGGIHFAFELTASHESCAKVADYVLRNYAKRKH
jgi:hypothetical protein